MTQKLKFKGRPIYLNGQNYYIPSLSTVQFEANAEFLAAGVPEDTPPAKAARWFHPVILLALQRNYPELTLEDLGNWLDLDSTSEALNALTGASKLERVAEGE